MQLYNRFSFSSWSLYLLSYRHVNIECILFSEVLKGTLKSETILATEGPLKTMKNPFYFTLKTLLVLKTFKAKTQCFCAKFRKTFFYDILVPLEKIFPGNIQLFGSSSWKSLNLKETVLISIITVKKRNLLLTLLHVKTILTWV